MPPKRKPKAKKQGGHVSSGAPSPPPRDDFEEKSGPVSDLDHNFDFEPQKEIVYPKNRVDGLTEEQLKEEITRVLTANDPNIPANTAIFNYKEKMFKPLPPGTADHIKFHFSMDGCVMHVESEEAKSQAAMERKKKEDEEEARRHKEAEGEDLELIPDTAAGKNQFNYSSRAAQTFNNPMRERGVATEPPATGTFSSNTTRWEIYDAYMQSYEISRRNELAQKSSSRKEDEEVVTEKKVEKDEDIVHSAAMGKSLKILERMVNQNAEDEIFNDFKYWEDKSDEFRQGEGSVLPLWRFETATSKRRQVTAIAWNPEYPDLFAVGYGSYDFLTQRSGMVCCFTLKNPSTPAHPEYMFTTEFGVMCLDFHPQHSSLLAVGLYDGTVMVYDVRRKVNIPIYKSSVRTNKHTDPVWQVCWQDEDLAKNLNFFSVSSDGRVANWIMSKNEFKVEEVMRLKLVAGQIEGEPDEETSLTGLAGGTCFDFNKESEHLFLVGTEEGKIHKCSKAYSGQYLMTYEGHLMAVYSVRWNEYHPQTFLSCSADWTVKLWDHTIPTALMSFDLGNAVGDIAWAPYSSTVFSCVTSDGKVHVYDLNINKHEALCEQKVVRRAKLTHIVFNSRDPVVLVGDDRGCVNSLKLSPNLRVVTPIEEGSTRKETEIEKMDALLRTLDKPEGTDSHTSTGITS